MPDRNAQIIIGLRNQASPEVRKIASDYRAFIGELQAGGASIDAAERKMLSLAQARARAFSASGQETRGEQELTAALGLVTTESTAAYNAQTRLATIQQRIASEARGVGSAAAQASGGVSGLGSAFGGLGQAILPIAGPAGLVLLGKQLASMGIDAGRAGLDLDRTLRLTRSIAGDTRTYTQILAAAKTQQLAFGGTLQENIDRLSGFAVQARTTGADLTTLITTAQRLSLFDPAQGIEGASIALREALSGDPTSLARRFEIPRKQLAILRDTSVSAADKLAALNAVLDKAGIPKDATQSVSDTAKAYNQLNAEWDTAVTTGGKQLADAYSGVATGLSRIIGLINGNPQAIAELKALFRGESSETPLDRLGRLIGINPAPEPVPNGGLAGSWGPAQQTAAEQAMQALRDEITETQASAAASLKDAAAKDLQTAKTKLLEAQTRPTIDAFLKLNPGISGSEAASRAAAAGYSPQIQQLIVLAAEARNATADLQALNNAQNAKSVSATIAANRAAGRIGRGDSSDYAEMEDAAKRRQADIDAANRARILATGTSAEKIALYQREYTEAVRLYGAQSAAAIRAETDLRVAKDTAARAALTATSKQTSELNKQLSLEERIRDAKVSQLKATLDASAAIIRDRQQRRQEEQETRQAERILRSGRASQAFKDAAADKLALISIEQQQRLLDINEKLATSNGQIVNGRVFQGRPGDSRAQLPTTAGAIPSIPTLPNVGAAGAAGVTLAAGAIQVFIDGKEIRDGIVVQLRGGLAQARSAGAGRG